MLQSKKHVLSLSIIPLCYYIFDYVSTVYTNLLFSGNEAVVQFMPSISCILYLIFILYYHQELAQQEQRQHQMDLLHLQLEHATNILEQMRNNQTQTIAYRHDMRHHCTLLQGLAATGDIEKINQYLSTLQADIEHITPLKFCSNEFINLILSTYHVKASNKNIVLDIKCTVPQTLSISDTQLCAILSNALENAIEATAQTTQRTIKVRLGIHNRALLIQIENPYQGTITYNEKLPVSMQRNHGIGTKSIANIVSYYNGQYEFHSENQVFTLKVLLPINEN
jgi:sensor histidine kinase regulating citrate/malate metabolism